MNKAPHLNEHYTSIYKAESYPSAHIIFCLVTILVLCAPDLLNVIAMSSGMTKFFSKCRHKCVIQTTIRMPATVTVVADLVFSFSFSHSNRTIIDSNRIVYNFESSYITGALYYIKLSVCKHILECSIRVFNVCIWILVHKKLDSNEP